MKKNYEQLMESHLPKSGEKKRLLLHVCCAPCSTAVLESLEQYFSITIFFYNPNLDSKSEFEHRAEECKRLVKEMGFSMDVIVSNYIHEEFLEIAKGLKEGPGAMPVSIFDWKKLPNTGPAGIKNIRIRLLITFVPA